VPEQPTTHLSQDSVDGWFFGYKEDILEDFNSLWSQTMGENSMFLPQSASEYRSDGLDSGSEFFPLLDGDCEDTFYESEGSGSAGRLEVLNDAGHIEDGTIHDREGSKGGRTRANTGLSEDGTISDRSGSKGRRSCANISQSEDSTPQSRRSSKNSRSYVNAGHNESGTIHERRGSRNSIRAPRRNSRIGRRRVSISKDDDGIEDIHDILKPLDMAGSEDMHAKPLSLPRFEWVQKSLADHTPRRAGSSISSLEARSPKSSKALPASGGSRHFSLISTDQQKPGQVSKRAYASLCSTTGFGHIPEYGSVEEDSPPILSASSAKHRSSTARVLRSSTMPHSAWHRSSTMGSTMSAISSLTRGKTSNLSNHRQSSASLAGMNELHVPRHNLLDVKGTRDQRTELKRLQQKLLASAQQAFDAEIWESCGIESEHLKRQQLAVSLISSGLFNIGGAKDELDENDDASLETATLDEFSLSDFLSQDGRKLGNLQTPSTPLSPRTAKRNKQKFGQWH